MLRRTILSLCLLSTFSLFAIGGPVILLAQEPGDEPAKEKADDPKPAEEHKTQ